MTDAFPAAKPARRTASPMAIGSFFRRGPDAIWWLLSVLLFAGVWEICWLVGLAEPRLLPPPHMFLSNFFQQGRFFSRVTQMGHPTYWAIAGAVASTVLLSTARVIGGILVTLALTVSLSLIVRYNKVVGNLVMPTVNLLAPISPVAWMPVALMLFGVGNAPVIFLVFISLFFVMTLATLRLIDEVPQQYINVARTMGASKRQTFFRVILPAIIPGMFSVLRVNLFAAWMMLLIAESIGVRSGLGLVVMVSRRTFNSELAFFAMTIIGLVGFLLDSLLKQIQQRYLNWNLNS